MSLADALTPMFSRLRARYAQTALPVFFGWWGRNLLEFLPLAWRAFLTAPEVEVWLHAENGRIEVLRAEADTVRPLGELKLDAGDALGAQLAGLLGDELAEARRVLLIAAHQVLVRRLSLPLAALENLRNVVGFELDRQTPFRSDQIEFDVRQLPRDPVAKQPQLVVELAVLPRPLLRSALESIGALAQAVDVIDAVRNDIRLGFNLLPDAARRPRGFKRVTMNLSLTAAAVVFLVLAMLQVVDNRLDAVASLGADVDAQRTAARSAAALRKTLNDSAAAATFLSVRKAGQPSVLELLKLLSQHLPDDTYLERITLAGGELTISGLGVDATELLKLLAKVPQIRDPGLSGSIVPDPQSGKKRFTITAHYGAELEDVDAEPPSRG